MDTVTPDSAAPIRVAHLTSPYPRLTHSRRAPYPLPPPRAPPPPDRAHGRDPPYRAHSAPSLPSSAPRLARAPARRSSSSRDGHPRRLLHGRLRRQAAPPARAPLRGLLRLQRRQRQQQQQQHLVPGVRQDLLGRAGAVVGAAFLRGHLPAPRGRRHRGPDPVQGVQGVRQAREELDQEAHSVAQEVRARQRARARHQRHHREDQAPVRELRQVRPALRLRRPAPPHRQRRPAALGRVHHPRPALPLHRRLDRVGRKELPHRHPRREEARHEGDHHRCRARHAPPPQGIHLARCCLPRAHKRRPRRRRRRHRLLLSALHGCWLSGHLGCRGRGLLA